MRESQIKKTPYTLILGDNEIEAKTVSYRKHSTSATVSLSLRQFLREIKEEVDNKKVRED